jgi:hypothetical protein
VASIAARKPKPTDDEWVDAPAVAPSAAPTPVAQPSADEWTDAPPAAPPGAAPDADPQDATALGYNPYFGPTSLAAQAAIRRRNIPLSAQLPPPPAPNDDLFAGIGKGAIDTGAHLGKFFKGAATGDFGPYDEPGVAEELDASTTPHGGWGKTGYVAEKIGELIAPSGIVRRTAGAITGGADLVAGSGRVLAEFPALLPNAGRAGRAVAMGAAEGLVNAGVTAAQTGDPESAAWAGLLGGLTAAPLKYFSKPERVAALLKGTIDPALAKGGAEAGTIVQSRLADARDAAGQALGQEYARISDAATGRVRVGESLPRVQELLAELRDPTKTFPELGATDDVNKAISILESFARTSDTVRTGLVDAAGNAMTREVPRTVSVEDALKVRSLLFKLSNSGNVGIGKGALQQLTKEWHGEIVNALAAQDPRLAQAFNAASTQYRQFITTFNSKTVRALVRAKAPEAVLGALLSGTGETTAENLRRLIPPADMEMVRASLWKRVLDQGVQFSDQTFSAEALKSAVDKLSPEARTAVFGSDAGIAKMIKLAEMMDNSWVRAQASKSLGGTLMRGAIGAGAGAALGAGSDRVFDRDAGGGWRVWGPAGAAIAISPVIVAKILARPGSMDVLERAMTTSRTADGARVLTSKLMSLVAGAEFTTNKREKSGSGARGGSGAFDGMGGLGALSHGIEQHNSFFENNPFLAGPPEPPPAAGGVRRQRELKQANPGVSDGTATIGHDTFGDMLFGSSANAEERVPGGAKPPQSVPPTVPLPEMSSTTANGGQVVGRKPAPATGDASIKRARQELERTGITSEQKAAYRKNISETLYRAFDATEEYDDPSTIATEIEKAKRRLKGENVGDERDPGVNDAWRMYLGMPQEHKTFSISPYTPSIKKDGSEPYYYRINNFWPKFFAAEQAPPAQQIKSLVSDIDESDGGRLHLDNDMIMREYEVMRSQDAKGPYIAVYDRWDLSPVVKRSGNNQVMQMEKVIGRPFEIYDRLYYDPKTFEPKFDAVKGGR